MLMKGTELLAIEGVSMIRILESAILPFSFFSHKTLDSKRRRPLSFSFPMIVDPTYNVVRALRCRLRSCQRASVWKPSYSPALSDIFRMRVGL